MAEQNEESVVLETGLLVPTSGNRKRGGIDKAALEELADSIRAVGVLQPLVVRPIKADGDAIYQIVAGERRWRASQLAGLTHVPCTVKRLSDGEVLRIQWIENLQRQGVHPLDEAEGLAALVSMGKTTIEAVAREVGKSSGYVHQRIKLLDLIPEVRKMFEQGKIQVGHALAVARLPTPQQKEAAKQLSWAPGRPVSEFERWIATNVFMDLSSVSFSKTDAELYPEAGACTACPKRTGFQPALFQDVGKADRCLDAKCFNHKLDQAMAAEEKPLKESGEPYLRVTDNDGDYANPRPNDALRSYEWTKADKGDNGAVPCLIVAGHNRGRVLWGKKKPETVRSGGNTSPAAKAAEKTKRIRERALAVQRRGLHDLLLMAIKKEVAAKRGGIPEDVLRVIGHRLWHGMGFDVCRDVGTAMGWNPPKPPKANGYQPSIDWRTFGEKAMAKMKVPELVVFLATVALAGDPWGPGYNYTGKGTKMMDVLAAKRKVKAPALVIPKSKPIAKPKKVGKA